MPKLGRRSEPQQLQYYYNTAPPISYAPFGNEYTPLTRNKIVFSKLQPILEKRANPQGGITPRGSYPHKVDVIAGKPTEMDPNLLRDFTRKINSVNQISCPQANQGFGGVSDTYRGQYFLGSTFDRPYELEQEFDVPKPTTYGRRPDSKDLGNKYGSLPPIGYYRNKDKNEKSTVFERESWTLPYRQREEEEQMAQQPVFDSGFNTNGAANGYQSSGYGTNGVSNGYQSPSLYEPKEQVAPPPPPMREMASDQRLYTKDDEDRFRLKEMVRMLPREPDMPEQPVNYNPDEQEFLLMMTRKELSRADSNRLKEVYLDITENYDRTLTGWTHYRNVLKSLRSAQFIMSDDLWRAIAAMFVAPSKLQEVQYEKLLSFIGTALTDNQGSRMFHRARVPVWPFEVQSPRSGLEGETKATHYYQTDNNRSWSPRAMRAVTPPREQDVTKLMKMTEQQLEEADIDFESLVLRFQQYDREMRETLSADQIKTVLARSGIGLQDSVINKILGQCGTTDGQYNWMKFVEFLERTGQKAKTGLPIPRSKKPLEYAKQVPSPVPQWPYAATTEPVVDPVAPLWKKQDSSRGDYSRRSPMLDRDENDLNENKRMIDKMDRQLRNLETEYEDMKTKLHSPRNDSLWFKYFMTFADELYGQDKRNSGFLPEEEVRNYTYRANSSYNLGIPDFAIDDTIAETCSHGRVNIHSYLRKLGNRNW